MSLRKFFEKIGEAVLRPKLPALPRPRFRRRKGEIPGFLRGFFESRSAGWPEYLILKLQISILLSLFIALAGSFFFNWPIIICLSVLTVYQLLLLPDLRLAFGQDYPAYRAFSVLGSAIPWILLFSARFGLGFTLVGLAFVFASFFLLRLRYGRNYTYGIIEEAHGRTARVRVGYDLRSNVTAGVYLVETPFKVRKGEKVKLMVHRPALGLRGAKIGAVVEKA